LDTNPDGDRSKGVKTANDWYLEAKGAFEGKAHGRALALVLYALRLDNERAEYHALHGKILDATGGDARTKVRALETAVKLNPKDVDSFILLAKAFQNLGMQARATRLWSTVHNLNPNHPIFNQPAQAAGKKGTFGKEQIQGFGEQFSALVAEARIALDRFFKRG
jgi:tetratricopeptide (TPR) repeat protein